MTSPTHHGGSCRISRALFPPRERMAPAWSSHHLTAGRGAHWKVAAETPPRDLIGHPLETSGAPLRALPSRAARGPDEAALSSGAGESGNARSSRVPRHDDQPFAAECQFSDTRRAVGPESAALITHATTATGSSEATYETREGTPLNPGVTAGERPGAFLCAGGGCNERI
jgi:hypothetical protein